MIVNNLSDEGQKYAGYLYTLALLNLKFENYEAAE